MTFMGSMEKQWDAGKHVCVGLDPLPEKLPEDLQGWATVHEGSIEHFTYLAGALGEAMVRVIDATCDIAAAYKPNTAFYERFGAPGWNALARVVKHAKEAGVPVILDAKRGDIGATNEAYAAMAFDFLDTDAITIHPYLGWEANKPFLARKDKGIFVLCRTSNPGAGEFQDFIIRILKEETEKKLLEDMWNTIFGDHPISLHQHVAVHVADQETWNQNNNCGLVTGGTYPGEIEEIRKLVPNIPLLIPGIGKQGGDLEASVIAARHRFLINSSSGIIFADDPRAETLKLHEQIQHALANSQR